MPMYLQGLLVGVAISSAAYNFFGGLWTGRMVTNPNTDVKSIIVSKSDAIIGQHNSSSTEAVVHRRLDVKHEPTSSDASHINKMEVMSAPSGVHIFFDLYMSGIDSGTNEVCEIVPATGIPDKASITMTFRGIEHKDRLMSEHDHYASDIYMTLASSNYCSQHGGYDTISTDCVRRGDLGHKWWWRGDTGTYIASIRPEFDDKLTHATEWRVCLGIGRQNTPHPYRISGALALHSIQHDELRRRSLEETNSISV
jgi:hypothetical protein